MAKIVIPAVAGGLSAAIVAIAGVANAYSTTEVTLTVDGQTRVVNSAADTVSGVLDAAGIETGAHDVVMPSRDTKIDDDTEVNVIHARPLEVTVDGQSRTVWTTADTVGQALIYLDLDERESKLSTSRSTQIARTGLSVDIATAKDVVLTAGGTQTPVTVAGTVQDLLDQQGIEPDDDDIVEPAPQTVLRDGLTVTYVVVDVRETTRDEQIPFESKKVESDEMLVGESEVTTTGKPGTKRITTRETYHDGELVNSEQVGEEVVTEPVTQITTVGTKEQPSDDPEPKDTSGTDSADNTGGTSNGHALNLDRASMWDQIAQCESSNNWSINTGNGYYGGLQFNLATWRSVNGQDFAPYPHQATRAEQITVANRLYAQRGLQPWACARVVS